MSISEDLKVALSLQNQLKAEQENKEANDLLIAINIQEQFLQEFEIEKPTNGLYYDKFENRDSKKSLIDPSWEIIDPTPDIHILFMEFDKQFFWNKLQAVCVDWSKRMTTCAGTCSYSGRGGMCRITLSEPLLKLRPRKDLVETLLHEMIHAYLFVTHNNKDRDGHGLEFHKHMFRINKEAGTHITVYHSFHDEVNLYRTHFWKCNGPCQYKKPHYGIVRRATNRAPGPNDFWWAEHARSCGGIFVKIKEPEKKPSKSKSKLITKPSSSTSSVTDIRKYFGNVDNYKENMPQTSQSPQKTNDNAKKLKIIVTTSVTISRSSFVAKSVPNGSSENDYSAVRSHWTNKYNDSSSKRVLTDDGGALKKLKTNSLAQVYVNCPICSGKCLESEVNGHLDKCVNASAECVMCEICYERIEKEKLASHMELCLNVSLNDDFNVDLSGLE